MSKSSPDYARCACGCGTVFPLPYSGPRPRYFSNACRQRAYRQRVKDRKKVARPVALTNPYNRPPEPRGGPVGELTFNEERALLEAICGPMGADGAVVEVAGEAGYGQ